MNRETEPDSTQARLGETFTNSELQVLEPRVLLDAAGFVTALEVADSAMTEQTDDLVDQALTGEIVAPWVSVQNNSDKALFDSLAGEVSSSSETIRSEVVFVDAGVEGFDQLAASFGSSVDVFVLDATRDGVEQIAAVLENRSGLDAVHIISHGRSGTLDLGNTKLTEASMNGRHSDEMLTIRNALSDNADILIYGCNFAGGARGEGAVAALASFTGADVAASYDLTGAADLGGDWDLEVNTGDIQANAFASTEFEGTLDGTVSTADLSNGHSGNSAVVNTADGNTLTISTVSGDALEDAGAAIGVGIGRQFAQDSTYDLTLANEVGSVSIDMSYFNNNLDGNERVLFPLVFNAAGNDITNSVTMTYVDQSTTASTQFNTNLIPGYANSVGTVSANSGANGAGSGGVLTISSVNGDIGRVQMVHNRVSGSGFGVIIEKVSFTDPVPLDTDGDGVADIDDVDDDNDGILDDIELSDAFVLDFSVLTASQLATLNSGTGGTVTLPTTLLGADGTTPVTVDIISSASPSAADSTTVNLNSSGEVSNGFDNLRDTGGTSGHLITFAFSEDVAFTLDTESHGFFGNSENIIVRSSIPLDATLDASSTAGATNQGILENDGTINQTAVASVTLLGDQTDTIHLSSDDGVPGTSAFNGNGTFWSVTSGESLASSFSVEYFRTDAIDPNGREPFRVTIRSAIDTDDDGIFDHLDIDSDNDGIADNLEAQSSAGYIASSGIGATITDLNQDGLDDNYDARSVTASTAAATQADALIDPVNTDGETPPTGVTITADAVADYLDDDSDGDGISDQAETGIAAATNTNDLDQDGLLDAYEGGNINDGFDQAGFHGAPIDGFLPDSDGDAALNLPLDNDLDFRDTTVTVDEPLLLMLPSDPCYVTDTDVAVPVTGLGISDADNPTSNHRFQMTAASGVLTVDGAVPGGVSTVTGNGTNTVELVGTIDQINATLAAANGVVFAPDSGFIGTVDIDVEAQLLGAAPLIQQGTFGPYGVFNDGFTIADDSGFRVSDSTTAIEYFTSGVNTAVFNLGINDTNSIVDVDFANSYEPSSAGPEIVFGIVGSSPNAFGSTDISLSLADGTVVGPINYDQTDIIVSGDPVSITSFVSAGGSGNPVNSTFTPGAGQQYLEINFEDFGITAGQAVNGIIFSNMQSQNPDVNGVYLTNNVQPVSSDAIPDPVTGQVQAKVGDIPVDTDGDGVIDSVDVDDDNDGILDSVEGVTVIDGFSLGTVVLTENGDGSGFFDIPVNDDLENEAGSLRLDYFGFTGDGDGNGGVGSPPFIAPALEVGVVDGKIAFQMVYTLPDINMHNYGYSLTSNGLDFTGAQHNLQGEPFTTGLPGRVEGGAFTIDHTLNNDPTVLANPIPGAHQIGSVDLAVNQTLSDGTTFERSSQTTNNRALDIGFDLGDGETYGINVAHNDRRTEGIDQTTFVLSASVSAQTDTDFDQDGIANHLDIDSDNDGITDNIESQLTVGYIAPSGVGGTPNFIDLNQDGLDDNYDSRTVTATTAAATVAAGGGIVSVDTDSDGSADYLDFDSDNDGLSDNTENGLSQAEVPLGTASTSANDADSDGLLDQYEIAIDGNANDGFVVNESVVDPAASGSAYLSDSDNDAATGTPLTADVDFRDLPNPPVLDLNSIASVDDTDRDFTAQFVAGSGAVAVVDADADVLNGDIVSDFTLLTITPTSALPNGANEILRVAGIDIPLNADFAQGGVTIPGTSTIVDISYRDGVLAVRETSNGVIPNADMDALIRSVTYENLSASPSDANDRTFDFQVAQYDPATFVIDFEELTAGDRVTSAQIDSSTYWGSEGVTSTGDDTLNGYVAADGVRTTASSSPLALAANADGNFLFHNTFGAVPAGESVVFGRSNIPVDPNTEYTISLDLGRVNNVSAGPFEIVVNNVVIGTVSNLTVNNFQTYTFSFTSGSTTAVDFEIRNTSTNATGNDFGIDNIVFQRDPLILSNIATATVDVVGAAPPVAQDDGYAIDENPEPLTAEIGVITNGDLFADNGNGADSDANGDPLGITQINGVDIADGEQITLPSGALLTIRTDGTFDYDPNGAFNSLSTGEQGTDTFIYTLSDGTISDTDTATVTITINGDNDAPIIDLNGPNIDGTDFADTFVEDEPGQPLANLLSFDAVVQDDEDNMSQINIIPSLPLVNDGTNEFLRIDSAGIDLSIRLVDGVVTANTPLVFGNTTFDVNVVAGQFIITNANGATFDSDDLEGFLRLLAYENTDQNNSVGARAFEFQVMDPTGVTIATSMIAVDRVNDAPIPTVLDSSDPSHDGTVVEVGAGETPEPFAIVSPTDAPAELAVSELLAQLNITDIEQTEFGIGIIYADETEGVWQYTRPDIPGHDWTDFQLNDPDNLDPSPVPDSEALLMDANAILRFVPNAGYGGGADIQFRVWDGTVGTASNPPSTVPDDSGGAAPSNTSSLSSAAFTAMLAADTDGDGIINADDVDDDNDGILDVDEGLVAGPSGPDAIFVNNNLGDLIKVDDPNGTPIVTTVGQTSFNGTTITLGDIGMSPDQVLYGAEFFGGHRLFTISETTGELSEVANFSNPSPTGGINSLSTDADGLVYLGYTNTAEVYRFDPVAGMSIVWATLPTGTDPAGDFIFQGDKVYIAVNGTSGNKELLEGSLDSFGAVTSFTSIGILDATAFGLAADADGNLLSVVDTDSDGNYELERVTVSGGTITRTPLMGTEFAGTAFGLTGRFESTPLSSAVDTDGDGIFDHLDIDSDDDGITDNVEAQTTAGYIAPTGSGAGITDVNQDGLDDIYDTRNGSLTATSAAATSAEAVIDPVDTDGLGGADFIDPDSDNDGIADVAERGDGGPTTYTAGDTDGDGLADVFEGSNVNDGYDVNDENLDATDTNFNFEGVPALNPDGSNAVPLDTDLLFRDVNNVPIAQDDDETVGEDNSFSDSVLPDNGNGADSDLDGDTLTVSLINGVAFTSGAQIVLPSGALLNMNSDGSYSYDPNGQFENLAVGDTGADSFTYQISDGNGGTDTATVSIAIVGANDLPVAQNDEDTTNEDTVLSDSVLPDNGNGSDADPDGDALTVSQVNGVAANVGRQITLASGALVTVNSDGTYDYDPNGQFEDLNAGESALDSFAYTISDGNGGISSATVEITIDGVADAPSINLDPNNDSGTAGDTSDDGADDGGFEVTFTENDPAISIVDADLTLVDPEDDIVEIIVTLTNGLVGDTINFPSSFPGNVSTAVLPASTLAADGVMTITLTGDSSTTTADWENILQSLMFEPSTTDIHNPDPADRNITFEAFDSANQTTGSVETIVNVVPENDPPTLDLDDDNSGGINAGNYLGSYTENAVGAAISDGVVISDLDDTDLEGMTITLTNGFAGDVLNIGSLPSGISVVGAAPIELAADGTIVVTLTGSASLADYQSAIAAISFASSSDDVDPTTREITVVGNDGEDPTPVRTAFIEVTPVNDPPEVIDPTDPGNPPADPNDIIPGQTGDDSAALTPLNASQYFADPDDTVLTYSLDPSAPTWLNIDTATGLVTGTPPSDASQNSNNGTAGEYDVVVIARDLDGLTTQTTAVYAISNPAPDAVDDAFAATENGSDVTGNVILTDSGSGIDVDPDGDVPIVVSAVDGDPASVGSPVAGDQGGLFTIDATGGLTFVDNGDFEDLAAGETRDTIISYTIDDGNGGNDTAQITVTVTGTNDAPEPNVPGDPNPPADPLNYIPVQNESDGTVISTPLDLTPYFSDPDASDVLTLSVDPAELPSGLSFNGTAIVGTPDSNASQLTNTLGGAPGTYIIPVTATDPNGATFTTNITYVVTNPAPVAQDDGVTTDEDSVLTGSVIDPNGTVDGDVDPDGDDLTVSQVDGDAANVGQPVMGSDGGTFTINPDGSYAFDPELDFNDLPVGDTRTTSITYQISDGEGGFDEATVTVTVEGVNDGPIPVDPTQPTGPLDPLVPVDPDDPRQPPIDPANYIPEQPVEDGAPISPIDLTPYFGDPDTGDVPVLSVDPATLPVGLTFDPLTNTISGIPAADASQQGDPGTPGTYTVPITATDPNDPMLTFTTNITYVVTNPAPVAQDDGVTTDEDSVLTGSVIDPNGTVDGDVDPDGDDLTVSQVDGDAANVGQPVMGSDGGTFTINPDGSYAFDPELDFNDLPVGDTRTTSITYQISDGEGGFDEATVTVTVEGVNDGPIPVDPTQPTGPLDPLVPVDPDDPRQPPIDPANYIPEQPVEDGAPISPIDLTPYFGDPDTGDVPVLSVDPATLPVGLTFDPLTNTISGTPAADASQQGDPGTPGTYTVPITATDPNDPMLTFTTNITYVVTNPAPVVLTELPDQDGTDGFAIAIPTASFFDDLDNDELTYSADGLPIGLSIDPDTGEISGTLDGNASNGGPNQDGFYTITITVDDGEGGVVSSDFVFDANPVPFSAPNEPARPFSDPINPIEPIFDPGGLQVSDAVDHGGNLISNTALSGDLILTQAVNGSSSLGGGAALNSDHPISEALRSMIETDRATGLGAALYDNGKLNQEAPTPYFGGQVETFLQQGDASIFLRTVIWQNNTYVDLMTFGDARISDWIVQMSNGQFVPEWIKMPGQNVVLIERVANVDHVQLTIGAKLPNDEIEYFPVTINLDSGEIKLDNSVSQSFQSSSLINFEPQQTAGSLNDEIKRMASSSLQATRSLFRV